MTKYDRLARSLTDLLDIVAHVEPAEARFRSLAEDIDTTAPAGRHIFHVFASIAQFERERIRERTMEGRPAARAKGRIGGRPPALSEDQKTEVLGLKSEGRVMKDIAAMFKVSLATVKRVS